jgi:cysteine synthase
LQLIQQHHSDQLKQSSPYKYEGIGVDFTSPVLDESVVDEFLTVSDADGLGYLKVLASKYGFLAGLASGAVAWETQQYAKKYMRKATSVL